MKVRYTFFNRLCLLCALAPLFLSSSLAYAVTLDLTSGAPISGIGNSFMVSNGGVSATIRGLSSADAAPTFLDGELNVNAQGVGMCNQTDGVGCGGLRDAVGNVDFIREFVFVEFSSPVFLNEAVITAQGSTTLPGTDSDASFFVGTGSTPDFSTLTPSDLGTVFNDALNVPGTLPNGTTRSLNLASQVSTSVDWLLLGASLTDPDPEDFFRLTSVNVTDATGAPIPEPSTILLWGTGLGGLILYKLRRKHFHTV